MGPAYFHFRISLKSDRSGKSDYQVAWWLVTVDYESTAVTHGVSIECLGNSTCISYEHPTRVGAHSSVSGVVWICESHQLLSTPIKPD